VRLVLRQKDRRRLKTENTLLKQEGQKKTEKTENTLLEPEGQKKTEDRKHSSKTRRTEED